MATSQQRARATADVAQALYLRVEREVPRLARRMIETFVAEIPLYAVLPREQLEGEILAITEANLRLFFTTLRESRALDPDELSEVRTSAARRAEERVPLDAVLSAYHVGGRIGWQALAEAATEAETGALIAAAERVLAYVQQVSAAVAAAYLEEQQTIYGEERDARRGLASALLAGEPADALAARLGAPIAPAYLVVAFRLGAHPDESDRGVGGAVAARRKVRRVQDALDAWAGEHVLGLLEPGGGSVLLPTTVDDVHTSTAQLSDLVERLQTAAGAEVLAGGSPATGTADIPRAAAQAQDVARLARQLGASTGGFTLRDVLLEYQLTRPSDAQSELAHLLDPLDRNPDLPHTLAVYLDHDLDRRSTASALHVHPNTLDYRLRRIVELTGLDPSTSRGLQLLGAALAARRLNE
ncbi:MAG TPA: helix-turn-helix domain-containing protein [Mycobacteriales bacterium]|nr:helix-turn-helix domain-containing protein [Mycobacteriales bacterium]